MAIKNPSAPMQKVYPAVPEQVQSEAPVRKEMTPERLARYEELRKRQRMSRIFAECKDKSIAVRWVRKDDAVDISHHEWMGFRIAKEPNPTATPEERRFHTAVPCQPDGTYVIGDVILMEILADDYEFFIEEGANRATALMNAGKSGFIGEAQKLNVPVLERDKAGNVGYIGGGQAR